MKTYNYQVPNQELYWKRIVFGGLLGNLSWICPLRTARLDIVTTTDSKMKSNQETMQTLVLLVKLSWHWPFFPYSFPHQLCILLALFTDKKGERDRIPMLQLKAKYRQEPCKASSRLPLCQNSLEGPRRDWEGYLFLLLATWHYQGECQWLQFFVM